MANATAIGFKSGRSWSIGSTSGIEGLKRTYVVQRGDSISTEETSFDGVPAIGSAHETYSGLFVTGYDVNEREDGGRNVLDVTVTYSSVSTAMSDINKVPRGQDIQSLGWRSGSVSRDLVTDRATGKAIVNSAGQLFESTPQYEVSSPVFTKVVKTASKKDWMKFVNCINAEAQTIDGTSYPAKTLRCIQVDEDKLWNDEFGWLYQYTISVQYLSNMVTIGNNSTQVEIGWDVAITDAGCYTNEEHGLTRISWIDEETGKLTYATTPQLLNGQGGKLTGDLPYNVRVQAYATATFPDDFFSTTPIYHDQVETETA